MLPYTGIQAIMPLDPDQQPISLFRNDPYDGKIPRTRMPNWTIDQDSILTELLFKECRFGKFKERRFGKRRHRKFKPDVWLRVHDEYMNIGKEYVSVDQLKNRWKNLKTKYQIYQSVVKRRGWTWDYELHLPVPASEDSWAELAQLKSKFIKYKGVPFPQYWSVDKIMRNSIATLECPLPLIQIPPRPTDVADSGSCYKAEEAMPTGSNNSSGTERLISDSNTPTGRCPEKQARAMGVQDPIHDKQISEKHNEIIVEEFYNRLKRKEKDTFSLFTYEEALLKLKTLQYLNSEEVYASAIALREAKERSFFMVFNEESHLKYWANKKEALLKLKTLQYMNSEEVYASAIALREAKERSFFMVFNEESHLKYWANKKVKQFRGTGDF